MAVNIAETSQSLIDPFVTFWNALILNIPGILGALVIIVLGYIAAILVGFAAGKIVEKLKVDAWLRETGRSDSLGGLTTSSLTAKLIKWWVFIAFLVPAANIIKLPGLSVLLIKLAEWLPHLIAGVAIMVVGLIAADFLADSASQAKSLKGIKLISSFIRVIIIIFFADIALREIGINIILAEQTILLIVGGIVLAASLAIGIGFGLGLKKHADEIVKDLRKKIK
tara:strand:- start:2095 stop:2769 length:675 start_codon:yes stop_codon:yes gene_type:complete